MTDTSSQIAMRPPRLEEGYATPTPAPAPRREFLGTARRMAAEPLAAARENLEASRGGVGDYVLNMPVAALNLADAAARGGVGAFADFIPGLRPSQRTDLAREILAIPEAFAGSVTRAPEALDEGIGALSEVARRMNQPGPMPETLFSGFGPTFSDRDLQEVADRLIPPRSPVEAARVDGTGLTSPALRRALEITQPTAPASQYLRTLIGNNPRIEQELRWSGAYRDLEALGDEVIPLGDLQSYVSGSVDLFNVETLRSRGRTGGLFNDPLVALLAETRVAPLLEAEARDAIEARFRPLAEVLANRSPLQLQEDGAYLSRDMLDDPQSYRFDQRLNEVVPDRADYLRDRFFAEEYGGRTFEGALRSRAYAAESQLSPEERSALLEEANRRFESDDLTFFGSSGETRYFSYVLPGARDYRENIVRINPQVAEIRGSDNETIDSFARSHFGREMVPGILPGGDVPVYHTRTVTLPFRSNRPDRNDEGVDGSAHFIAEAQSDAQQRIRSEANSSNLGVYDVTGGPEVVRDRYNALEREGRDILGNVEPIAARWHNLGREAFDLRRLSIGSRLEAVPPDVQRRLDEIGEERSQLYAQAQREAFSAAGSNAPLQDILDRALRGSFNERFTRVVGQPPRYIVPDYAIDEGRFEDIMSSVYPERVEMGLPLSNSSSEWLDHALRRELRVAIDEGRDALVLTPGSLPQTYSQATPGVAEFYDTIGPRRMTNLLRQLYGRANAPNLDRVWVQTRDDGWVEAPAIRINDGLVERVGEKGLQNFRAGGEVKRGIGTLSGVARGMFGAKR